MNPNQSDQHNQVEPTSSLPEPVAISPELVQEPTVNNLPPSIPVQSPLAYPALPAKNSKKVLAIIVIIVIVIVGASATLLMLNNKNKTANTSTQTKPSVENKLNTDKVGIQKVVDKYCQKLATDFGFANMNSGYIISDRFSEQVLSDSPDLFRFKQIGDTAVATIDCLRSGKEIGAAADMLFIKENGVWDSPDVVQSGFGLSCTILDKYSVSKELVSKCAPKVQGKVIPRL
jgi:hypothetical protein